MFIPVFRLPKREPKPVQQFEFTFLFADGTYETAVAPTSGEARALIKKFRGIAGNGRLPVVKKTSRKSVTVLSA